MGKVILGLIVLAIIALVVCFAPIMNTAYTAIVDYQDTETYYGDEPYHEIETYVEAVPLDYKVVNSFVEKSTVTHRTTINISGTGQSEQTWEEVVLVACVTVLNTDSLAGIFEVTFSLDNPVIEELRSIKLALDSNEEETARCPAYELGDWQYSINPATKMVQKERTVVKYKQVEKQRPVTKQRPETRYKRITVLDYLRHR